MRRAYDRMRRETAGDDGAGKPVATGSPYARVRATGRTGLYRRYVRKTCWVQGKFPRRAGVAIGREWAGRAISGGSLLSPAFLSHLLLTETAHFLRVSDFRAALGGIDALG